MPFRQAAEKIPLRVKTCMPIDTSSLFESDQIPSSASDLFRPVRARSEPGLEQGPYEAFVVDVDRRDRAPARCTGTPQDEDRSSRLSDF